MGGSCLPSPRPPSSGFATAASPQRLRRRLRTVVRTYVWLACSAHVPCALGAASVPPALHPCPVAPKIKKKPKSPNPGRTLKKRPKYFRVLPGCTLKKRPKYFRVLPGRTLEKTSKIFSRTPGAYAKKNVRPKFNHLIYAAKQKAASIKCKVRSSTRIVLII